MQNLVRVEGMSLEAMRAGINWEFESFDDYLALIERQGVGPNIAAFVGHSSVRTYVMGSDAPLRSATVDEAERVDPLDFMFDLALSEELETTFLSVLLNSDESAVARLLTHEYSTVALSDAGAHLTFFCDAGFGLHLMGHWARVRQIMPLTEAIRRVTSHPAEIFGIRDRGRTEVGTFADLLLFDPETVGRGPSRRVWDLPAEQRRLTTDPLGVHGVWVNGTRIVDANGVVPIDNLPGRVLREF